MSLDEAIRYYSRLADECRRKANIERYDYMDLKDLAAEHGQLADWLNELKVLREKIQKLLEKQEKDRWIPVSVALPKEKAEYLVTYHPCYWDDVETDIKIGIDSFRGKTTWAKRKYQRVIAFRPLPEPYQEDKA